MIQSGKRFAAREFLSAIESLESATPWAIEGMAKADPEETEVLLFSADPSCTNWIALPLSLIESVEPIGRIACDDHHHPVVRIILSDPATPEAAAFAALARAYERLLGQSAEMSNSRPARGSDAARSRLQAASADGESCGECFERCNQMWWPWKKWCKDQCGCYGW